MILVLLMMVFANMENVALKEIFNSDDLLELILSLVAKYPN